MCKPSYLGWTFPAAVGLTFIPLYVVWVIETATKPENSPLNPGGVAKVRRAVTELAIEGMTCNNCARHVTEALQGVAGVQSAQVSLEAQAATVRWEPNSTANSGALLQAVQEAGFEAKPTSVREAKTGESMLAGWGLNLLLGVPVTAFLMAGEWLFHASLQPWFQWTAFGLATVVQVFAGARFYRGAWGQLKAGSSNMDTLVALGSTTSYGYSAWALLSGLGGHLFFMEAAAIITLISVGHWVESRVAVKASGALNKLLNLAPALARKVAADGREEEVPAADLVSGDRVVLRPGDRVPVDGVVEEGESAVDESMLTGESVPIDKSGSSELYAGTVNLNGRLVMKVTAIGEDTALANIIAAVQRAQTSRANIQRLGDRISNVFVPVIVAVAVAAGLFWALAPDTARQVQNALAGFLWHPHTPSLSPLATGLIIAAAVLIVACPCAMGLATPAAIMAGSNAAAERGILIRDGLALEKAGQITAVMLDKTGTLTIGRPTVAKTWELRPGAGKLAGALAKNSSHPLSQAIAVTVSAETPTLADWEEVRGSGIQARLSAPHDDLDGILRLGSVRWLQEQGVNLVANQSFIQEWSTQGASLVGLAHKSTLLALFALKDALKPGSRKVVSQLQQQGLKAYLVTGDNKLTALSIGQQTGIPADRIFAEVSPNQKAGFVKQLQDKGECVAFVGDGINDAPALEQADLGIAVSKASDIAREAADMILLKSEIEAVPESLGLARATLRTIKQNLFWAFFYNVCGIPLAALGFMSPVLCAAAMGLSDLVVIGNALRLRRWRG